MSGSISFGGLLSGLDTKSIVEQLTNLRTKQLVEPVQKKIDALADRQDGINGFRSAFEALKTSANTLNNSNNSAWNVLSSSSSDSDAALVSATSSAAAIKGTYDISSVTTLAKSDRVLFDGVADKDTTLLGEGTIKIKYGTNAETTVTISSAISSLENIKNAINNADIGVSAAIVNDGTATPYRLVLTGGDTGADNTVASAGSAYPEVTGSLAATLTVDTVTSDVASNQPADAAFTLNGLAISSASNTVSTAVPGVTFTLLATKATSSTITVKQDTSTIAANISKFITDYSNLRTSLRKVLLPDSLTGKLQALGKESILQEASLNISAAFTRTFQSIQGAAFTNLTQIGITTDIEGNPTVDTGILSSALNTNLSNVQAIFQGTTLEDGIAEKMYSHMNSLLQGDGTLARLAVGWANTNKQYTELLKDREDTVARFKERLQAKYNRLEQQISALKSREGSITAFANANNSSNN